MAHTIVFRAGVEAELAAIPDKFRKQIMDEIRALAADPRPPKSKQLKGKFRPPIHRVRSGDYRVLYTVNDTELVVLVVRVSARKDVYRRLASLQP